MPTDILNKVRQIKPDDYFAPIVGEFEHLVLLALVRLGNGAFGAAIRREIRERTGRDAAVGSVYMALARLEKKKMVVSYAGQPDSATRRTPPPALSHRHRRPEGARPRLSCVHRDE